MAMSRNALIVIDMLNPYDHEDAEELRKSVSSMVLPLAELLADARKRAADTVVVYVNDNQGDFSATRDDIVGRALNGRSPDLVHPVVPSEDCAFLPKVRHSAFFGTSLEYLLRREEVDTVILTGQVTEQCVLYTALDAYIRHLSIRVVSDAVASIDTDLGAAALEMMRRNMRAEIVTSQSALTAG
jgi:nicotinamidase-related amidase